MMLRALVALLVLANLVFFGWTQGWLDGVVGWRAGGDREPERLASQVRPETVVILPRAASASAAGSGAVAGVAGAPVCLEAGPFAASDVAAAEAVLRSSAPSAAWNDVRIERPGTWLLYMGSYPDRETLRRKEQELGRARAAFEEISLPGEGALGLSLGRFEDRGAAERALEAAHQRNIRSARVVQVAPAALHMLRVERAAPALAAQLGALKSEALGNGFVPCANAAPAR